MLARRRAQAPLDEIIALDSRRAALAGRSTALGEERNRLSQQIGRAPASDRTTLVARTRELRDTLRTVEAETAQVEEQLRDLLLRVPNIVAPEVPAGKDDTENIELRRWGKTDAPDFPARDHVELGAKLGILDIERAGKVAGSRSYFLRNEAVWLELALVSFAMTVVTRHGFRPVIPPVLVKEKTLWGTRHLPFFQDQIYKIEGDDIYLVGTSEVPLAAMHMDEILSEAELPLRYAAFSPCYRTELGTGGRDIRGLMRTHQFDKVEMFVYSTPETAPHWHDTILAIEEEIYQALEIPYRVMLICTGDLGPIAAKKYDIEAWKPADGTFREVTSTSNCTDFQARGLNTRYRPEAGGRPQFVHMLNGTAIAIGRTIAMLLENHQQADGSVLVPQALRPFLPAGLDALRPSS